MIIAGASLALHGMDCSDLSSRYLAGRGGALYLCENTIHHDRGQENFTIWNCGGASFLIEF